MTNPCLLSLRPLFSTYRESAQHSFGLFLFFHFEYPSYVLLISTEEYNDCRKNKWALDRESNREAREYVESVQMAKVTKVFVLLVKKNCVSDDLLCNANKIQNCVLCWILFYELNFDSQKSVKESWWCSTLGYSGKYVGQTGCCKNCVMRVVIICTTHQIVW